MWNREASPQNGDFRPPRAFEPATENRPLDERRVVAWVGKSVIFKGDLISSEDMTIDGRVEGTIELREHSLTIGPDAHIRATIIAKTVTVLGAVTGMITASDKVDVRETGSVEGNIISPRLAMADGAVLRGRVDTSARDAEVSKRSPLSAVR
jgi:cytoskeletal protein CcmA (bactofilin family)